MSHKINPTVNFLLPKTRPKSQIRMHYLTRFCHSGTHCSQYCSAVKRVDIRNKNCVTLKTNLLNSKAWGNGPRGKHVIPSSQ